MVTSAARLRCKASQPRRRLRVSKHSVQGGGCLSGRSELTPIPRAPCSPPYAVSRMLVHATTIPVLRPPLLMPRKILIVHLMSTELAHVRWDTAGEIMWMAVGVIGR